MACNLRRIFSCYSGKRNPGEIRVYAHVADKNYQDMSLGVGKSEVYMLGEESRLVS